MVQYVRLICTYSVCASIFRRGGACSVARGAGAASGGASARGPRPGDIHVPLRHTLDAPGGGETPS